MRKILILEGSPRKHGNTARLADAFARGARESGHTVTELFLKDKTMGDCLGCCACRRNGGQCVQKDDMGEIYTALGENDVIVLACPVYFYTWTSLMKRMIDRTFAVESSLHGKTFYLLSTGAASKEGYMQTMLDSFTQYVSCFQGEGNRIGGHLFGCDTRAMDDIDGKPVLAQAYALGKEL